LTIFDQEIIVENIEDVKEMKDFELIKTPSLNNSSRPSKEFQSFSKRDPEKANIDKIIDVRIKMLRLY